MRTIKVAELQSCGLVADAAASATPHFGMVKFSSGPVRRLFASRLALLALLLAGQIRPLTSHSLPHRLGSALTTWFCTHLACLSFAPALVSTLAWVLRFPWFHACLSSALASRSGSVFACLVYLLTHRLGFHSSPYASPCSLSCLQVKFCTCHQALARLGFALASVLCSPAGQVPLLLVLLTCGLTCSSGSYSRNTYPLLAHSSQPAHHYGSP